MGIFREAKMWRLGLPYTQTLQEITIWGLDFRPLILTPQGASTLREVLSPSSQILREVIIRPRDIKLDDILLMASRAILLALIMYLSEKKQKHLLMEIL